MTNLPEYISIVDGSDFFCLCCNEYYCYGYDKKKYLNHIKTKIHNDNIKRLETQKTSTQKEFYYDLVELIVRLSLPFLILDNEIFRNFLWKYTKFKIPYKSDLYKDKMLKKITFDKLEKIRNELVDKNITIYSDTTTDAHNSFVTNVYLREVNKEEITHPYLIDIVTDYKALNGVSYCNLIRKSLDEFYEGKLNKNNVVLLVTDQAGYCRVAGKELKKYFGRMLHITCLDHMIQNLVKKIVSFCNEYNRFCTEFTNMINKSPQKKHDLKEFVFNLPPKPSATRWGTQITFAKYLSDNFPSLYIFVEKLKKNFRIFHRQQICSRAKFYKQILFS